MPPSRLVCTPPRAPYFFFVDLPVFGRDEQMAQSCGGDAVSMQGAVVKALVRLVMERPVALFAAKSGEC